MKKTIALTHPKLQPARLVDSIKYDIKKYLNRERRKTLPAGWITGLLIVALVRQ